jgi:hypothetical protein
MAMMVTLDDMNATEVREAIANGEFLSDCMFEEENRECFNCMGYAFGCYAWMMPLDAYFEDGSDIAIEYSRNNGGMIDAMIDESIIDAVDSAYYANDYLMEVFVDRILKDFSDVRVINDFDDLNSDEYGVVFACGDDDFHFGRYDEGIYSHKQGNYLVEIAGNEDEIFGDRYYSDRIYFAKKKDSTYDKALLFIENML